VRKLCLCGHTEDLHIKKSGMRAKLKKKLKRPAILPVNVGDKTARPENCRVFLSDRLTRGQKGIYCPCDGFNERVPDKPVVKTASVNAPPTVLCAKCELPLGPRSARSTSTTHRRCAA
jgi:hypothetical protein